MEFSFLTNDWIMYFGQNYFLFLLFLASLFKQIAKYSPNNTDDAISTWIFNIVTSIFGKGQEMPDVVSEKPDNGEVEQ